MANPPTREKPALNFFNLLALTGDSYPPFLAPLRSRRPAIPSSSSALYPVQDLPQDPLQTVLGVE